MKHLDKFPGLENIQTHTKDGIVFIVNEPFTIDLPEWCNNHDNLGVAFDFPNGDSTQLIVYAFVTERRFNRNLRKYINNFNTKNGSNIKFMHCMSIRPVVGGVL